MKKFIILVLAILLAIAVTTAWTQNLPTTDSTFKSKSVRIYPTPSTNGLFNVVVDYPKNDIYAIEIFDMLGRSIYSNFLLAGEKLEIDLNYLPNIGGVYSGLVTNKNTEEKVVKKIVINKMKLE